MSIKLTSQVYVSALRPYDIYSHFAALLCPPVSFFNAAMTPQDIPVQACPSVDILGRDCPCASIAGIGWGICGKPEAAAVQFLAFIVGLTGIKLLLLDTSLRFEQLGHPESRWYLIIV